MNNSPIPGRVHSIQTLGTLDGPGVRFVIFMQGCPLRCGCCHNPDTWDASGGITLSPHELVHRALRYREYFGNRGGVTLSGGEPLLQAEFSAQFFRECKKNGLHTCLDTSGVILDDTVKELLTYTDHVLLDIKYPTDELYQRYVGCGIELPLRFLEYLAEKNILTTLRQVIIPTLNDSEENASFLASLKKTYSNIDRIELLPFKKLCAVKYEHLNIPFRFANIPEAGEEDSQRMEAMISASLSV